MSSSQAYRVEHMLRTRLARQAGDLAVKAWTGFPQPQMLRLKEILPTLIPTRRADSEAALTYKSFSLEGGQGPHTIVAFVKLFKQEEGWARLEVELCETAEHRRKRYLFKVVWFGDTDYPANCPIGQGPFVRML